ncbi:hypothetical protein ACS0TY_024096 [Phlomoides rotata]
MEIGFGALLFPLNGRWLFGGLFMGNSPPGTISIPKASPDLCSGSEHLQPSNHGPLEAMRSHHYLGDLGPAQQEDFFWTSSSDLSLLACFWAYIREAGIGIKATMRNSLEDFAILSACGVKRRPPRAPSIKCIRWQPPLPRIQVMKINVDGGASGSPGHFTGGVSSVITLGCLGAASQCRMGGALLSRLSSLLLFKLLNLLMIGSGPTSGWKVTLLMWCIFLNRAILASLRDF